MKLPQPIPYQGSKRLLAPVILKFLPENQSRLVEPFAGSGALSIAAASSGKCERFLLNDLNTDLINLLQDIVEQPQEISDAYERLWLAQLDNPRAYFQKVRERFNQTRTPADFLYVLARCIKGAVRYNASGEFNQSPDNRRFGRKPASMREEIIAFSSLLKGKTTFTSNDYETVLANASEHDVIYMDPPYQGTSGKRDARYVSGLSFERFVSALQELNAKNISYLISYDGSTGEKQYGKTLPGELNLHKLSIITGRSAQATLLGRNEETCESLYVSKALLNRLTEKPPQTISLCKEKEALGV